VVMQQHNIWCVCVRSVWRGMLDCSPAYLFTQNAHAHTHTHTHTHIKCYAAASPHWLFTF